MSSPPFPAAFVEDIDVVGISSDAFFWCLARANRPMERYETNIWEFLVTERFLGRTETIIAVADILFAYNVFGSHGVWYGEGRCSGLILEVGHSVGITTG